MNNSSLCIDDGTSRRKLAEERGLDLEKLAIVSEFLLGTDPLYQQYKSLAQHPSSNAALVFERTTRQTHGPNLGSLPVGDQIAAVIQDPGAPRRAQAAVWKVGHNKPSFIEIIDPAYEALQVNSLKTSIYKVLCSFVEYPLLYPGADVGWHTDFRTVLGNRINLQPYAKSR